VSHDQIQSAQALQGRTPLERLYAATTAIGGEMEDERHLLERIVRELARLVDARYAALGILGSDGSLMHFETTGLTEEEFETLRDKPPHGRGILGALLHEGKPLRLDDLTQDPRSVGFPPGHPPMRTFLGVPLVIGERVLGRLYVTEKRTGRFSDEDETLALGFAGACAVAIQSARQATQLVQAERLRATGELAVGIAHDFNNLLATILGRTEVLLGQVRDPEQRESLAAIRRAARDGASTVARMREYGRPVDTTEFRLVDLGDLAAEAVQLARPRWQGEAQRLGRTIDVQLHLDPTPPVFGDPAALREVLVNLLFNAVDALPSGGTITVSLRSLAGQGQLPSGEQAVQPERADIVELAVSDTGVGIPDDLLSRVFEPFFTTKGSSGTGLGLPMVRKVIEAHGGTVSVKSRHGTGTTVRIVLAAAAAATGSAEPVEVATGPSGASATASEVDVPPATIVLVDDQEDVLDTMGMLLRRDGHDVRPFRDPRVAVETVLRDRPDVVITDLGMPGLSGWDVARQVRERWPDLPVIVLTGWRRDVTAAQLRQYGVLLALAKPAEVSTVRQALARALNTLKPAEEAPLHVLLVDDAAGFASVLSVLIGQRGHSVQRVETVGAALAALETEVPLDLIILDLNLPDRPSLEVLVASRKRARPPVVCVASGSAPRAMQREVPGADLYVEKAYVSEQLEHILTAARRQKGVIG
jgi:signal transduction histidine kinase/DNA-binding response OmpR family regulator